MTKRKPIIIFDEADADDRFVSVIVGSNGTEQYKSLSNHTTIRSITDSFTNLCANIISGNISVKGLTKKRLRNLSKELYGDDRLCS